MRIQWAFLVLAAAVDVSQAQPAGVDLTINSGAALPRSVLQGVVGRAESITIPVQNLGKTPAKFSVQAFLTQTPGGATRQQLFVSKPLSIQGLQTITAGTVAFTPTSAGDFIITVTVTSAVPNDTNSANDSQQFKIAAQPKPKK